MRNNNACSNESDGEKKEASKYHLIVQPKSLNLVI